ncbi:MAG: energy transducer TonB family protein [Brevundimonas sp.]
MNHALIALLAWAAALPAQAQDATQDWDLHRNTRTDAVMAFSVFDNGLGVAVRCVDGAYEALLSGLPAAPEDAETRTLGVAFGDDDMAMQRWGVATNDTVAVGERPAPFARKLRQGGRMQILVPGGGDGGRNLRYDLTLPASSTSIDETLNACERPLVDPRDAEMDALPEGGLPSSLVWVRTPQPDYPSTVRYGRGFAVVSCLVNPDGTLRDCGVDSEHPHDGGFGASTLRGIRRARVQDAGNPDTPLAPVMVSFRARFMLDGYETREDRQAYREQQAVARRRRAAEAAAADQ